jgi:hypothetical protein
MASGVVRPPSLDLANRDLVEADLNAVWHAESGHELAADIPHILDLTTSGLPVKQDVMAAFDTPDLVARSIKSMKRILDAIGSDPTQTAWAADRKALATSTAADASKLWGFCDRTCAADYLCYAPRL